MHQQSFAPAYSSESHIPVTLELMQHCRERLVSAAMPSRMLIAAELPHLPCVRSILMTDECSRPSACICGASD